MTFKYDEEALPGGARKIALAGTLDSAEFFERGDEWQAAIVGQGGRVLLDLSGLEFVSSAGMRLFLRCAKALAESDGELHLAAPQPRVMSVLTIGGYVPLFPVHQTIEEALAALDS